MSEQEKRDSCDLATMLKDLPKEDMLRVQGVIIGMRLANKLSVRDSRNESLKSDRP